MSDIIYTPPAAGGTGNISGTLTPTYIPYASGVNAISDSIIYNDVTNSRIGIGTTTPAGKLDIVGTSGTVSIETNGNSLAFTRNDANYISAKGGTSSFLVFETGLAERVRINSAGNVGINTTTPFSVSALTLQQSSSLFFALSLRNRNQTQRWDIAIDINAVDDKILGILDGTSGTTRLAITDTGNVGIGTTSPAQSLDVNGLIRSNRASNTDGALILGTTGTYLYAADSGGYLASYTANLERMRITSAGDVGIGTTTPQLTNSGRGNLTINGTTDSILTLSVNDYWAGFLYATPALTNIASQGYFQIDVNGGGTTALRITTAGDVGIGTTVPFRKLTINGNTDVYMGFRASGIQTTIGADNIGKFIVYDDTTSLYTFIINSNGQAGIGTTSVNSSAQLQIVSPTNNTGFLCPQLTNAQILAISTPAEGLMVYNTDIAHICFYQAGAWVKISHTPM